MGACGIGSENSRISELAGIYSGEWLAAPGLEPGKAGRRKKSKILQKEAERNNSTKSNHKKAFKMEFAIDAAGEMCYIELHCKRAEQQNMLD